MKVIGRDIGDALDPLVRKIKRRLKDEAGRTLTIEPFEGDSFSRVRWADDGETVTIFLHDQLPTHAVPHALAIALQHIRQRLDEYPEVRRPRSRQSPSGAGPIRTMLREVVMAPEAESQVADLELDREWELEQRHAALKEILRQPPTEWTRDGTLGCQFAALQYARFEFEHPPKMWKSLREEMEQRLPIAAERGKQAVAAIREHGWADADACIQSLLAARDALGLEYTAWIEDRRSGEIL